MSALSRKDKKALAGVGVLIALGLLGICIGALSTIGSADGDGGAAGLLATPAPSPPPASPAAPVTSPAVTSPAVTSPAVTSPAVTSPAVTRQATSAAASSPSPSPKAKAGPKPKPRPKPATVAPGPEPQDEPGTVYYANCSAVRAAGADPIRAGDPGYSRKLDRDGDGVGCE